MSNPFTPGPWRVIGQRDGQYQITADPPTRPGLPVLVGIMRFAADARLSRIVADTEERS